MSALWPAPICKQAANQSFCETAKNIRRNSASSVIIGDKAFLPKCAKVIEHRPQKIGKMIYRQNYFISFCHKLSEICSDLEKLIV
ncbi:hypothetical protein DCC62_11740 [candidate division KSB1 bacterium]|nr:MAG: hypothetical protein DCC62_11740 [candidate division KSB1 bacterium]